MFPLFESIKVVNGILLNLEWHQQRVDQSRKKVLQKSNQLILKNHLQIPEAFRKGVVKCRVSYGEYWGETVFSTYYPKKVETLKQVACEPFDYSFKYEDRTKLQRLYQLRGSCDDILITIDGVIKDTSYSNVALYDGRQWFTPQRPLLEGTQRAKLLASGVLTEKHIYLTDLNNYLHLALLNAMLDFKGTDLLKVSQIELWEAAAVTF